MPKKQTKKETSTLNKRALDIAVRSANKKHGVALRWLSDIPDKGHDFIPTGCMGLDHALGGGLVRGRIVEIFGPPGSGKSTLALNTIAQANDMGLNAFYADVERALDPKLPAMYGVDPKRFMLDDAPISVESRFDILESVISSGEIAICVLDSVSALITAPEMKADTDKEFMGKLPKFLSEKIRRLIQFLGETNTLFIFINQVRSNLGGYGNPETTPGGAAIKFYATHRVRVSGGSSKTSRLMDENGEVSGHKMTFEVVKNKIAAPYRKGEIDLIYGQGYDMAGELVDIGASLGLIDQSASWFTYLGEKYQGKPNMRNFFLENNKHRYAIKGEIKELLDMPLTDTERSNMEEIRKESVLMAEEEDKASKEKESKDK